jgi:hypothetical protein
VYRGLPFASVPATCNRPKLASGADDELVDGGGVKGRRTAGGAITQPRRSLLG